MSEIQDHVSNLSQSIGPRPAGTEEEQQAALYLAEALQKEAGLPTDIEDFNFNPNYEVVRASCCIVSALMALIAVFVPMVVIPAVIVSVIAAVLFALEVFGKPVVSNLFSQGISQNVVARYQPAPPKEGSSARRRKVVLVAHYDSGKVRRDLSAPVVAAMPIIRWAELAGMILLPVLTLVRLVLPSSGAAVVVVNAMVVIAALLAVLPFVGFVVRRLAPYNEAANCNAAGVAVMTEVATRLGRGFVAEAEAGQDATIHGEDAARASGYVPEGTDLVYESPVSEPIFEDESPEARLLAAKAAVAALSGKPVSNTINIDISSNLVQVKEPPLSGATAESMLERREQTQAAFGKQGESAGQVSVDGSYNAACGPDAETSSGISEQSGAMPLPSAPAGVVGSLAAMQQAASLEGGRPSARTNEKHDVPDWFKAAQKKAKKTAPDQPSPSQRSRYAGALDAAEREIAAHAQNNSSGVLSETEQRLQQMRNTILASQPPRFEEPEMREVAEAGMVGDHGAASLLRSSENAIGDTPAILCPTFGEASGSYDSATGEAEQAGTQSAELGSSASPEGEGFQTGAVVDSFAESPAGISAANRYDSTLRKSEEVSTNGGAADSARATNGTEQGTVAFAPVGFDVEELRREMEAQKRAAQDEAHALESLYPKVPIIEEPLGKSRAAIAASIPSIAAEPLSTEAMNGEGGVTSAGKASIQVPQIAGSESGRLERSASSDSQREETSRDSETRGDASAALATPATSSAPTAESASGASSVRMSSSSRKKPTPRKKRSISLPSLTGSLEPIEGHHKQEAPLAQDAELSSGRSSLLRRAVPAVGTSAEGGHSGANMTKDSLRASLPSLSGVIREQNQDVGRSGASVASTSGDASPILAASASDTLGDTVAINVNQAGSFASVGATGAFAPVGDELLDDVDPNDVYVDDADDSAYEDQYTETGAFAGPGYVEMPKSRASRFFGRFRSKKKERREETTQEWLDVDEDFDARSVGKARGGWESFREEAESRPAAAQPAETYGDYDEYSDYADETYDGAYADDYDDYRDEYDDEYGSYSATDDEAYRAETTSLFDGEPDSRPQLQKASRRSSTWNGGAFSRESLSRLIGRNKKSHSEEDDFYDADQELEDYSSEDVGGDPRAQEQGSILAVGDVEGSADPNWAEGTSFEGVSSAVSEPSYDDSVALDDVHAENIQRIYGFRHADVTTEVWFVALGAQLAANAGMEAFVNEHADDLRGAIIIDLDGLGAGDLTLIEHEGTYRSVKGSSRMKRYVRKASVALGMEAGSDSMLWGDSAAACAIRHGHQAMHLAGMKNGKPAYFGEAEDVADNVSEKTMLANADFVMEILKNV